MRHVSRTALSLLQACPVQSSEPAAEGGKLLLFLIFTDEAQRGFPDSSVGNESTRNAGDLGSIPGLGRSPREGKGYPLKYSGLENSMGSVVHGVAKSWTQLSDFHFTSLPREVEYTVWAHNSVMWGQDLMS